MIGRSGFFRNIQSDSQFCRDGSRVQSNAAGTHPPDSTCLNFTLVEEVADGFVTVDAADGFSE